jgi:acetolactate synthase I/II/III large subunit
MELELNRNGGHVVVDALTRAGTKAVFALHGVQIDPIFQACADLGVHLVDVRHESSAGFAAEAYARITGHVGVALVCPGPGFTNVLTSIANAWIDQTSVVYIVGSTPASALESNGLQVGLDHLAMAAPVAKWTCKVASAQHLARIVAQAVRVATTAPFGPVVLDLPADVLAAAAVDGADHAVSVDRPSVADVDVDRFLSVLAGAERPALLVGHSPSTAARDAVSRFTAATGVPCFVDYRALGTLADDDRCSGGTLYQFARLPVGSRPDVVLAVGVQFGFDTPGLRDGGSGWGAKVLHVHADPAEIGRLGPVAFGLTADPDSMLASMAERCGSHRWVVADAWAREVISSRERTRAELDTIESTDGERIHPYAAARVVSDVVARSGAVLIGDGAVCKHWLHDALRLPSGARYLTHGRFGCMGIGAGMSIGAAFARPDRPVICVTGDGAVGFALGEFEAMVRHGLPIVVVVMNNARWGASFGSQMKPGGRQRAVGTSLSDASYHEVMVALGGLGMSVATIDGLNRALATALESGRPTCINVRTNNVGLSPEVPLLNG